ncbi:MAG TPA: S8 family serine peptidase [Planctomycetota bacterium]|jgi:hypothetical protein|nr:S8 family serine peptidase [Planctomycetota bacterium]
MIQPVVSCFATFCLLFSASAGEAQDAPFVAEGALHRVIVPAGSPELANLAKNGGILWAEDYGSFTLAYVDTRRTGGIAAVQAAGLEIADEMTRVDFNGITLDGADPAGTEILLASIPEPLRAAPPTGDGSRLQIVQFTGPIKDAWLDALQATGARVVTYVANDAYVVKTGPASTSAVALFAQSTYVLALTEYHAAFKLRPALRPPALVDTSAYDVIVQVIADAEGAAFVQELRQRAIAVLAEPERVLGYVNCRVRLDGANVLDVARDARVFAVEPVLEPKMFDERQGQIMAGNLTPNGQQPSGPNYFAWLASKAFPGVDPFNFAVDVEDDGVDRGSNTDVNVEFKVDGLAGGASRVVYNNNYTNDALAESRAGHGNINASIVFGYNSSTGSSFEDSLGYQYGLGIAPWVKVGNSKVFNNNGAGIFNQATGTRMQNAWNGGARISTNSWGFTSGNDYNTESQAHDVTVRDAASGTAGNQEMTIVFAAGNSGPGSSTVHPPGTAKNVITAGASENWRMTGTDGCGFGNSDADNAQQVIGFSGRGPTSDQRKKPELCAPGVHIQGAASRAVGYNGLLVCDQYWPIGQTLYAWSSGTSHSTPAIAGACALVRQFFLNQALPAPSPALTKAFLVAGASYMTGVADTLWSNTQGMGLVNLATTFDTTPRILVDQIQVFSATGNTYTVNGTIGSASVPFRVVLAWTDPAGPTSGNAFVNNLDLEVTINGTLYRGNVFSGANSTTGGTADIRNNLESVFRPAGTTGTFSITVRATNIAGDGVPGNGDSTDQDFALVVYNTSGDCNGNGIADNLDIQNGTSQDCDANGVPDECQPDGDGDGTIDACDGCPSDPLKTAPGQCGCGVPDTDTDGDGTANCHDGCPNDPLKIAPGQCGCGVLDTDTDGDGTADCIDGCPNDPLKTAPGQCGCGTPDTDSDGDGTANCHDGCPNDPNKIDPGICGCGVPDTDSDGDGTPNCLDGCPNDPLKIDPGICGCGVADIDSDGDGTYDCDGDKCPNDPNKIAPGICGCGIPDTDTDGDTIPDCIDNCITIPNPGQADCDSDGEGDVCAIAGGAPDCNGNGIPDSCDIASGTTPDQNGNGIPDVCEQVGVPYCFGDGSGAACPCGNTGAPGHGCANSVGQSAQLSAAGTTSPDTIVLSASGELPTALTIFVQGPATIAPAIFGDGLRCVGGSLKRLYAKSASGGVVYAPHAGDPSITARSAALGDPIASGDTRYYMTYYRDPSPSFCPTPPGGTFNASNALSIVW